MPNPPNEPTKELLRKKLRKITIENANQASQRILAVLRGRLRAHGEFRCIALFSAMKNEPDLQGLVTLFPDRRFVFPRIEGATMCFHETANPAQLSPGCWGIDEPSPDAPLVRAAEIDLVLCPGMAFTRSGIRLGRGRGYYDRYLGSIEGKRPLLFGVCFSPFVIEHLPHESHDIPMDEVIDETSQTSPTAPPSLS